MKGITPFTPFTLHCVMFEREQTRRALFFARYEAFQRGSPAIETEHLLLALFRDEQSVTARVFARARGSSWKTIRFTTRFARSR